MILETEVKYCLKSKIERVESKVKLSSQQGRHNINHKLTSLLHTYYSEATSAAEQQSIFLLHVPIIKWHHVPCFFPVEINRR